MRRLLTISGCLVSCIPLGAQVAGQRQIPGPIDEPQIVRLNIVATDNHGQPVNDLSSSDLQISDEGSTQQILYFRRVDRQPAATPTLAPNERSNRTAGTIPHATVILVDLMNEGLGSPGYATRELRRYLGTLESADYLYLYVSPCVRTIGQIFEPRTTSASFLPARFRWYMMFWSHVTITSKPDSSALSSNSPFSS